jgi:autotransporter translocation and assembly factor TamB
VRAERLQRDGKTWQVSDAHLAFGGARVTLDGTLRDTIEAKWSINAPALDRLLPEAAGSIQSTGTASGALKSPHVVAQVHGENLRYAGWVARQLEIDADVDAARDKSFAADRASSPARARQSAHRSAASDRHRRRDGSSHCSRRHRLSAWTAAGRAARCNGNLGPLRQGSLERDHHHDRAVDRRTESTAEDSGTGDGDGIA